ncbi:MAG TPA: glycosyltransferase, partial [Thermoleophilaceae bacterium]|nr:glycosyltransferase [Thermoleophilaceae bacterium]
MNSTGAAPPGRTLAVFHLADASGPSLSLRAELAWLASGGPVEVVVPGDSSAAEAFGAFAEVTVLDYETLSRPRGLGGAVRLARRMARDTRTFREHIRRSRPARVVVVTTALPAALLAAHTERVPTLLYAGEVLPAGPGLGTRLGTAVVLRVARSRSTAVVCCSDAVAGQFEARGAPRPTIAYPPIGEHYADGDRQGMRERLGIPPESPCVVAAGSISRGRGQDVLLRALPALRREVGDVRVVIAGEPHPRPLDRDYRRELAELARRLGVDGVTVFPGFVERMADLYAAADVVVNPALQEGFGRVAAEALVAGRPVVSTAVGGVPEVLRAGVDALLVPPADPAALAAAVAK